MDAVRRDDHISLHAHAVCEDDDRSSLILLEADALIASRDNTARQPCGQHSEKIGAVDSVKLDLVREVGGPHRCRIGTVGMKKLRIEPARTQPGNLVAESEPAQHPDAVRLQRDAGADFGECRRLFVGTHFDAALKQGMATARPPIPPPTIATRSGSGVMADIIPSAARRAIARL